MEARGKGHTQRRHVPQRLQELATSWAYPQVNEGDHRLATTRGTTGCQNEHHHRSMIPQAGHNKGNNWNDASELLAGILHIQIAPHSKGFAAGVVKIIARSPAMAGIAHPDRTMALKGVLTRSKGSNNGP